MLQAPMKYDWVYYLPSSVHALTPTGLAVLPTCKSSPLPLYFDHLGYLSQFLYARVYFVNLK